jgi:yecA family protein
MLLHTRRAVAKRQAEAEIVLPPNLRSLGELSFTPQDQETLRAYLNEGGWPREAMDFHTLEGYLVALLVLPVELPPGAWLPMIWGERGWKIPAKLAGPQLVDKFVLLVSGFLQELDRRLSIYPVPYEPAIAAPVAKKPGERPDSCTWASGFLDALQQHTHAQGLKYRSEAVKAAAMAIARCASLPPGPGTSAELGRAVNVFVMERGSRGPLEILDSPPAKTSSPRRILR